MKVVLKNRIFLGFVQAVSLAHFVYFGIFPANMHPFLLGNEQNREMPAIMHPLESFSRFQGRKA
ncbi:hypothetical protein BC351_15380 [Paenibacillus ferrarius]|uniref:Uncharacterized protein n=1 Tax=Paenibacillus ferrarius TaxID=1469647 RepID=A0A1V4HRV2_9BACL|nr:hypothetical protein BC351_15380 [Paenibacillus ferrarius]